MSFVATIACRSCGASPLQPVLDLGLQPLANAYRSPDDTGPEPRYPLVLVLCPSCSLVQLSGTVPPREMFDEYAYFSSYSTSMVESMRLLAHRVIDLRKLGPGDLVVEVASNDGYLLRHYLEKGIPVLGVEPAANVAEVARTAGVPTMVEYFGLTTAHALRQQHGPAAVVHANNVMAHVPDINDFVAGIAALLADDGVAYVESPDVTAFVAGAQFDTTYHEHVFYYSLTAISRLVERHGLMVSDVEELTVHGGSLRCTLRRAGGTAAPAVAEAIAAETDLGVSDPAYYRALGNRVEQMRTETVRTLRTVKDEGGTIAAYGAAAKGTVLLNHFGIGTALIDAVVDRNPHKQGLLMPGVGIPIVDPGLLADDPPSHLLLLVWNLAAEVLGQQRAYLERGGRVIIPGPTLRIVSGPGS